MTSTRDARIGGPSLREAHRRIGRYLATELVSQVIRLESYPIPHVQGGNTDGYPLRDEAKATMIALMQGGEPMAFGVSDVFPLAMFVHAKEAEDVKEHPVKGQDTIILVDSVVNSVKSVVEFVKHFRESFKAGHAQIVVVAGVGQLGAVTNGGALDKLMQKYGRLSLVALRLSDNQFTGRGGTDTGNRLFNTTHVD